MVKIGELRYCECCSKKMKDKYAFEKRNSYKWENRKFCPTCDKKVIIEYDFCKSMDKHIEGKECGAYYKKYFNKLKENRRQLIIKYRKNNKFFNSKLNISFFSF